MSGPATHHPPAFHRNAPVKVYCRAATTVSITIATDLNNGDAIDGVTLATGDRVLVKDQATGSQNGIFVVGATPARADDMDTAFEVVAALVVVTEGTANGGKLFRNSNIGPITLGTTALTFTEVGGSAGPATSSMVPYYIAPGDTFTVPLYKQALFKDTIEVDGILVVLGRLNGVD